MAVTRGRIGTVEISTDGGSTFDKIGRLIDGSLNIESAEITTTSHDSDDWEEFLQGRKNATIETSHRYDEADTGQDKAIQAAFDETEVDLRWRSRGTVSTAKQYTSKAFVRSLPLESPNDEENKLAFTIRLTGVVSRTDQ